MNKRRILITGAISLLGKYLLQWLPSKYKIFATFHEKAADGAVSIPRENLFPLDVRNNNQVQKVLSAIKPHIVIHLASLSNIDYCEKNSGEAKEVNIQGTKNICTSLSPDVHLIFLSSNAVFDGTHPPYDESDLPNPQNIYGLTKKAAEEIVYTQHKLSTIIRCTTIFGWPPLGARGNDVTLYLQKLQGSQQIKLVKDIFFNPIYAHTVVRAIDRIISLEKYGIFHVAGKDRINRYEFVKKLVQVYSLIKYPVLIPLTHTEFKKLASRPPDATLKINKAMNILHIKPHSLLQELKDMKKEKNNWLALFQ